ncbi:MAG TPA: hypothetical protein VGL80_33065 [Pseudonocardiaceae bacterium]|jgi:hypothetical protein
MSKISGLTKAAVLAVLAGGVSAGLAVPANAVVSPNIWVTSSKLYAGPTVDSSGCTIAGEVGLHNGSWSAYVCVVVTPVHPPSDGTWHLRVFVS